MRSAKKRVIAAAGLSLYGWAAACGQISDGDSTDGHTSWLSPCQADEDCEPGLSCDCGVCTRICSMSGDCADIGGEAVCIGVERDATGVCQTAVGSSEGICSSSCTSGSDCASTLQCQAGVCVPEGTGGTGDAGGAASEIDPAEAIPEGCNDGPAQPIDCACTRRCGVQAARNCPRGTGLAVSQLIGPGGGTIDNGATLHVPAGALDTETTMKLTESGREPPPDLVDWSPVYVVDLGLADLRTSATIDVPYSNNGDTSPPGGAIYWSSDGGSTWSPLADSYLNAGFFQAALPGSGYLLAAAPIGSDCLR